MEPDSARFILTGNFFATAKYIIHIFGHKWFAIYDCPTQGAQWLNTNIISPEPLLEGSFPWIIGHDPHVIPRSATSFVVVVVRTGGTPDSEIHVLLFTLSDMAPSIEDIYSVTIPRGSSNLHMPIPSLTSRYALGVLSVTKSTFSLQTRIRREHIHFTVRIDFPDLERGSASENQGGLTLRRMELTPAVDLQEEYVEVRFFDCLTGRVWFNVSSPAGMSNLVVDYLSMS